ncbi:MAG: hypothetical protein PHF35_05145 [Candidatus Moranbacteria bacterium]|nr:hypothetical protein [Candidatus Moranbacteria bacterium]
MDAFFAARPPTIRIRQKRGIIRQPAEGLVFYASSRDVAWQKLLI